MVAVGLACLAWLLRVVKARCAPWQGDVGWWAAVVALWVVQRNPIPVAADEVGSALNSLLDVVSQGGQ